MDLKIPSQVEEVVGELNNRFPNTLETYIYTALLHRMPIFRVPATLTS